MKEVFAKKKEVNLKIKQKGACVLRYLISKKRNFHSLFAKNKQLKNEEEFVKIT